LAVFFTLDRHGSLTIVVLGARDVAFVAPPRIHLRLPVGTRLSLFPMAKVHGQSQGLHWPIGGIEFHPCGVIGTSNRTAARDVWLGFDQPRMLVILPRVHLAAALRGLLPPDVPVPAHGG
jgi:thiamine pyrophosphokinase